jgi:type IV pilus assembly protein PilC
MAVSIQEKMFFAEHLSLMLKGGISLGDSLDTLKKEIRSKSFKKALGDILKRVLEGESLAKSMGFHPNVFDNFFRGIINVGEESGRLEDNLKYLAVNLGKEYELRKKIKGAFIYPMIVVLLAVVIALITTFFVLPKVTNLLSMLKVELPLATKILINSAKFFQHYYLLITLGIILFFIILKIFIKIKKVKFFIDKISLLLPFFGKIFRSTNLARFSQIFYTLLQSGIPILDALEISSRTMTNAVFQKDLAAIRLKVERGEKLSRGLMETSKNFPLIFCQMVSVGEKSGSLEDSFLYLSNFYEREVDSFVKDLSVVLEPILLILVGVFVAFVAFAIITPIFRFTQSLRPR